MYGIAELLMSMCNVILITLVYLLVYSSDSLLLSK